MRDHPPACPECNETESTFDLHGNKLRRIVHVYGCPGTLDYAMHGDIWTRSQSSDTA